jgi:hypothetical protein
VTEPAETPTETYDPKKKPKEIGVDSNGKALDAVTTANVVVGGDLGRVGCILKDKKTNGLKITDYDVTAKLDPKKTLIPKNATKKLIAHEAAVGKPGRGDRPGHLGAVPGDDRDPAHPDAVQALDDASEDCRLADHQQRLVRLVGQGPHPARTSAARITACT